MTKNLNQVKARRALLLLLGLIVYCVSAYLHGSKGTSIDQNWFIVGAIVTVAITGAVLLDLAKTTDLLRDSEPADFGSSLLTGRPANLRRPYSLAQSQMAWWFFLVFAAYVYISLTGDKPPTITNQALILMGLGAGTALGAAAVDQTKSDPAEARLQDLIAAAAKEKETAGAVSADTNQDLLDQAEELASTNFLNDILTDEDGIALHRFQALVWTLIFGAVFIASVVQKRAMPTDLDPNSLALLGISNGAYLGFKVPEQPARTIGTDTAAKPV